MSKMYVKIVDAKVVFSNSLGYNRKGVKGELFIHTYVVECTHERGRKSRFVVKTFDNKKAKPLAERDEWISLTGELIEEKWKDREDKWVSRVAIVADHIEVVDNIEEDDEVTNKKKQW